MSAAKFPSGAVAEFDENFFSSIAVPQTKDYSRLSSSPSRDQPSNLECDTPVKIRLPTAQRESTDTLPCPSLDILSSSSSSENTVRHSGEQQQVKEQPAAREPLKIVPDTITSTTSTCTSSSTTSPAPIYSENELIEGIEKMSMFAPKAPEERLSQRRRSEQKSQKQAEKNASSTATSRIRSVSAKRSIQAVAGTKPVARPRHNSVTRTASVPISSSGNNSASITGVVTRSMAARAAMASATPPAVKPIVRRSVMPLKVAQKTPIAAPKDLSASGGDRSRDRTRRSNTTNTSAPLARRSVLSAQKPAVGARNPVALPRRSASANKSTTTSTSRPIAHANRSSILRMNAVKPTQSVTTADAKAAPAVGNRNRLPLRVNPVTPMGAARKVTVRPAVVRPSPAVRSQSVERQRPSVPPVSTGTPRLSAPKTSSDDLFARLSTPKCSATVVSARSSKEEPTASGRKTAVRPVPSYIYNKTSEGMPSSAGLHGIRAPSRERTPKK